MKWTRPSKLRCEIWMSWSDFVKLHYAALLKNTGYARQTAQMKAWSPGVCMIGFPRTGCDSRRLGGRFSRRDLTFWGDTRAVPFKIIISAIHNSQMKGWCIGFITARLPRTWYFSRPHGGKFDRRDLTWKGPLVQSHHWRSPFGYAIMPIQDQNSGLLVVRVPPT